MSDPYKNYTMYLEENCAGLIEVNASFLYWFGFIHFLEDARFIVSLFGKTKTCTSRYY